MKELVERGTQQSAEEVLRKTFREKVGTNTIIDAIYYDSTYKKAVGVVNLPIKIPITLALFRDKEIAVLIENILKSNEFVLIKLSERVEPINLLISTKCEITEKLLSFDISNKINKIVQKITYGVGFINDEGEHEIDLLAPSPGPHFYTNLLLGNRVDFPHPLQTTPKSVVDKLGRGSFRSHAATQVLATRWDMIQEENGFPANRQFYLLEDNKLIFYSANIIDKNIESGKCIHSQNQTKIIYKTKCGLLIERLIFLLPHEVDMPIAVEAQQIIIRNNTNRSRDIKIVYTGMFGAVAPGALMEDVLYSNIIMQAKILTDDEGSIMAITSDYYPLYAKGDYRFHTMISHNENVATLPKEFCTNYSEFVGSGSLERPEGVFRLSNNLNRKGPGFFAISSKLLIAPYAKTTVDNFTGLVSSKINDSYNEDTFKVEVKNLINKYSDEKEIQIALNKNKAFLNAYGGYLQINSGNIQFDNYVNKNLPFQVLYQTFVSRSFDQTQKGYREIGFREIQDIYASMYYFIGMGEQELVKSLIKEWAEKVFEFGYAYHNFFWIGKEPGKWSDDALWLIQAVYRYINLTCDTSFLNEQCKVGGNSLIKTRSLYGTMKAIIKYSGEISIGKHGLPLLDFADWNDCLKLDEDFINGVEKEKRYKEQISRTCKVGQPFESDYSESVMNGFLLKLAMDEMLEMAKISEDTEYSNELKVLSSKLYNNLQKHAWKEDFFARVLFNRYKNHEYTYLGAKGDKLSDDANKEGTYFLNSFNWSILSDCATEEQIEIMLLSIEKHLKTPYGIKLISPMDLEKIAKGTATGEYFPGDRENGGIFKHATMMATSAMFKAAKKVKNVELARKLTSTAYWMIDLVLPYNTMNKPFETCGNPRFCTQYNNSDTGENVGPTLSGTSTWLTLSLIDAFGIENLAKGIKINPILMEKQKNLNLLINTGKAKYNIEISKPEGFFRMNDSTYLVKVDGMEIEGNIIDNFSDGEEHNVKIQLE
ncbi:GH36-type glycosyl hydrolase domain-containing protein [Clostridium estertheticum]|uniref:GH36-type glycosyl hydrolase domain-containing protein n=1 Tax=Clostridium estertheticum TaxID=238834 RepID=UPI001C7D03B8|nr:amylo-alpha-1,6-glucosidase [Clostridium estertheticum]MBX4263348.1 glycosyl transferase [Clostridium estertheticum]WLC89640.1 glycosyl transferase [Clostridium estertheticum]